MNMPISSFPNHDSGANPSLKELSSNSKMSPSLPSNIQIHHEGKRQIIDVRDSLTSKIGAVLFMAVWLTGWTIGCVVLLVNAITNFDWFSILFLMPFLMGWIFGAYALVVIGWFGKQRITLDTNHLEVDSMTFGRSVSETIAYKEITDIKVVTDDESSWLRIESKDKGSVDFATQGKESTNERLRDYLKQAIPVSLPEQPSGDEAHLNIRKKRPEDSQWHKEPNIGNETCFLNQGKFSAIKVVPLLLASVFWNSIVAVFLISPFTEGKDGAAGGPFWFIYLFMIPFVLIGLGMIRVVVRETFEPFRWTYYQFSSREIRKITRYFGIPFSKSYSIESDVQMEKKKHAGWGQSDDRHAEANLVDLLFLEAQPGFKSKPKTFAKIKKLTIAEAEWISTQIEKEQRIFSCLSESSVITSDI